MNYLNYLTVVLSVLVFLLIVFYLMLRNRLIKLEREFDEFTLQQLQELYRIKSKLKILQEEFLMVDSQFPSPATEIKGDFTNEPKAVIKNQILELADQGLSIEQIAKQSSLPEEQVRMVLNQFEDRHHL